MTAIPCTLFAAALGYAVIRYHLCKGVPWAEFPLYTVNKAFALAGLALVCAALVQLRRGRTPSLAGWAAAFMAIHVVVSLSILEPGTFPKYFADGRLTMAARWSWLAGVVAAPLLWIVGRGCTRPGGAARKRLGAAGLITGVHAALLGAGGWFTPSGWPGGMLPITLLAALLAVAAALLAALSDRRSAP
ncbi:MAG: hypothetical protein RLZZ127_2862 [Planctomycetota bacterium]|jgi:hypothetical protein